MPRPDLIYDDDSPAAISTPVLVPVSCVVTGCTRNATRRYMLGDTSEHIAQLDLCDSCGKLHDSAKLECALCKKTMMIEKREQL